jgi:hypothetical protein
VIGRQKADAIRGSRTRIQRFGAAASLIVLAACGGMMTTEQQAERLPSLGDVSQEQWAALAQRKIFFGHQSVGDNVMTGVGEILDAHPEIALNVVASRNVSAGPPAFHHALVGRNDYPLEKLDDFVAISSTGFGEEGGIAMVKLCYVDIHKHTNAQALFDDYRRRVTALRARNPALTIVHFTAPLTGIENWKGWIRATVTGNATARSRNRVRNRFNALMRATYQGREPLFDIARLESTLPDGRRVFFGSESAPIEMLAPEYTHDGGHLNSNARRMVAEQLLILLARLQPVSISSLTAAGTGQ